MYFHLPHPNRSTRPSRPSPSLLRKGSLGGLLLLLVAFWAGCGPSPESRRLIQRLNSKNVVERLQAISETPAHADGAVRAALLKIFEDDREPPLVRGYAGMSLGTVRDPHIVPSVMKQLPDSIVSISKPGPNRQLDAFLLGKVLTAYGPDALPSVEGLMRDPRKEVVAWTIMHHGSYRHSDRAYEFLAKYLNDRDVIYRRAASFGLSMLAHKNSEDLVLQHLADPDSEVRYNLAWALVNYGSSKGIRPLESQLAREKEETVRQEIGKALAIMKTRPIPTSPLPTPRTTQPQSTPPRQQKPASRT